MSSLERQIDISGLQKLVHLYLLVTNHNVEDGELLVGARRGFWRTQLQATYSRRRTHNSKAEVGLLALRAMRAGAVAVPASLWILARPNCQARKV